MLNVQQACANLVPDEKSKCCRLQSKRFVGQSFIETPLVFVRKSIQNLKCYVAPVQSMVQKQVCSDRYTLNQQV